MNTTSLSAKGEAAVAVTLVEGKALDTLIASIAARGKSLAKDTHKAACSVLETIQRTGDVTIVNKLINAVHESQRRNALRDWLTAFGPIKFDGAKPVYDKKDKAGYKTSLSQAMREPFWQFSPEPPYQPIDVTKAIAALVKRLEKDATETKRDHSAKIKALVELTK